jgi:hypothetical protein
MRRAERNEQPFCSPSGRDRAFEKLLRLARGEEELHWDIDEGWEEEDWYAGFVAAQMEQVAQIEQMEQAEKVGEMHVGEDEGEEMDRKGKGKEQHERKDSKEVALKGEEGWGRTGKLFGFGKLGDADCGAGLLSHVEYMEDIKEHGKRAGTARNW